MHLNMLHNVNTEAQTHMLIKALLVKIDMQTVHYILKTAKLTDR